jgi:O-antigen/teichoic acid export membrane protein
MLRSAAIPAGAVALLLGAGLVLVDRSLPALVVAATLPLAVVRLLAVSARQGRGDLRTRALVMFLAWPVVQFATIPLFPPAVAIPVGYALSLVVGATVALAWAWRRDPELYAAREGGAPLFREGWPLWLQGMGMAGYTWLDQVLLALLAGTAAAGSYGPVAALAPLYGLGLTALNGRFAPMIAARYAANDEAGLADLYRTVTRQAVTLGGIPLAVTLGAAPAVLGLWPGGDRPYSAG